MLNGQEVARAALALKKAGFVPDVMLGHNGWGEIWYLKDIYPKTPLIGYFEFFYRPEGADIEFEPGVSEQLDTAPRLRTKNIGNLLGLEAADLGQCPTRWQQSLYPERYRSMLRVIHEGIDTRVVKPNPSAKLSLPNSNRELTAQDEIVTYVARNLEPYRGFQSLMRSLPAILSRRPNAHVIVVGGDEVSYGNAIAEGQNLSRRNAEGARRLLGSQPCALPGTGSLSHLPHRPAGFPSARVSDLPLRPLLVDARGPLGRMPRDRVENRSRRGSSSSPREWTSGGLL